MQPMTKFTTAFVLSGISASIAFAQTTVLPETRFSDNFESNTLASWPFSTTTVVSPSGNLPPSLVTASETEHVHSGQYAAKVPGRNGAGSNTNTAAGSTRISFGALFNEQTADETYVLDCYLYDVYGQTGLPGNVGDSRSWISLRSTDGTTPFQANQLISYGWWNSLNAAFGSGFVGNMYFGTAPAGQSIGNHYAGRILSVAPFHGFLAGTTSLELGGNSAPGWFHFGVGPDYRRTNGWHKFTIAYNVRRVEFFKDSMPMGSWDINPELTGTQRKLNAIVLNPPETSSVDYWIDDIKVRSYPNGSMQILPDLSDVVNPDALPSVPLTLELTPINGNSNPGVAAWTSNMDNNGEINVGFPAEVRGEYELRIVGGTWLQRRVNVTLNDTGVFELKIPMNNGDLDLDGEVTLNDIDLTIASYGQGEVGPNGGDVDLDGEVTLNDVDIVIAHYGEGGE